jgi:Spy/CpxP family protein refolding chaperone
MKRLFGWLVFLLLAGLTAYLLMRQARPPQALHAPRINDVMPGLTWLKGELKLTNEQFQKISALHEAYLPRCSEMCEKIEQSRQKLETLAHTAKNFGPEYQSALRENAEVHLECQSAMIAHLYEVAATLNAEQSRCYLDLTLPHALGASRRPRHESCPLCQSEK